MPDKNPLNPSIILIKLKSNKSQFHRFLRNCPPPHPHTDGNIIYYRKSIPVPVIYSPQLIAYESIIQFPVKSITEFKFANLYNAVNGSGLFPAQNYAPRTLSNSTKSLSKSPAQVLFVIHPWLVIAPNLKFHTDNSHLHCAILILSPPSPIHSAMEMNSTIQGIFGSLNGTNKTPSQPDCKSPEFLQFLMNYFNIFLRQIGSIKLTPCYC